MPCHVPHPKRHAPPTGAMQQQRKCCKPAAIHCQTPQQAKRGSRHTASPHSAHSCNRPPASTRTALTQVLNMRKTVCSCTHTRGTRCPLRAHTVPLRLVLASTAQSGVLASQSHAPSLRLRAVLHASQAPRIWKSRIFHASVRYSRLTIRCLALASATRTNHKLQHQMLLVRPASGGPASFTPHYATHASLSSASR